MVKKLRKMAETSKADKPAAAGLLDSQLAQTIKDSAQQIWLAGLGAFAKAQGEGARAFKTLIKEGTDLQRKTQEAAEERMGEMADKVTSMYGQVGDRATAQWDKLETIFEERTARALNRLGVPTAKDVEALTARVEELASAVEKLSGTPVARKPRAAAPRKRTAASKSASSTAASPVAPLRKALKTAQKSVQKTADDAITTARKSARKTARKVAAKVDAALS